MLQCEQSVPIAHIAAFPSACMQEPMECWHWVGTYQTCSLWSLKNVTSCLAKTMRSNQLLHQVMVSQDEVVLVGGAYADARRALQPNAAPLEWPAGWRALESCTVLEVRMTQAVATSCIRQLP